MGAHRAEAGSDARAITTTTTRHSAGITVRGTKCFITNAPVADVLIVQTQVKAAGASSASGYQSVVVERDLPGVSFGPPLDKVGFRGSPTGDVFLDDVPLGPQHLLGTGRQLRGVDRQPGNRAVDDGLLGARDRAGVPG